LYVTGGGPGAGDGVGDGGGGFTGKPGGLKGPIGIMPPHLNI